MHAPPAATPLAVNFHLIKACDSRCKFCFATFRDLHHPRLPTDACRRILDAIREAGCAKVTFAGGEPTLRRDLGDLVEHARNLGMVTAVVTNGSRLAPLLDTHAHALDWVGLSVDSACEATQRALGRGHGDHVAQAIALSDACRAAGVRVKLNTVVTALNWEEDLSDLVRRMAPERWKVFQVLRVEGQNDGDVEPLLIDAARFHAFVDRHRPLRDEGFPPVVEDNAAMTDSYVMIDPQGCFYGDTDGKHRVSEPILVAGVATALSQVGYDPAKFLARGGRYDW